jgi:hypothetical protein
MGALKGGEITRIHLLGIRDALILPAWTKIHHSKRFLIIKFHNWFKSHTLQSDYTNISQYRFLNVSTRDSLARSQSVSLFCRSTDESRQKQ